MSLAQGFDGIIFNDAETPSESILPFAFDGIIISYSSNTIFITVRNGLNRPVQGVTVQTIFEGDSVENETNADGLVIIESEDISTLNFSKNKAFRTLLYTRSTDGDTLDIIFQPPLLH